MAAMETPAVTPAAAEQLPAFSTREARFHKAPNANRLVFAIPARSSLLLPLLEPKCHAYEERDRRWLHLLQAAALVPSRKTDKLRETVSQSLKLLTAPVLRHQLEAAVKPVLDAMDAAAKDELPPTPAQLVLGLRLKDCIAGFLRDWIADPIEGFVLRKETVVAGLRLDDLVATPVGAGYLRGFRREDGFCTVLFPWGHGFIHVRDVEKAEAALKKQLGKRRPNEFVALEHQHLYEQVESLLENFPPEEQAPTVTTEEPEGVSQEEYEKLIESLEEEHVDTDVLRQDLSFVRRVQALAAKSKELHAAKRPRLGAGPSDEAEELKQEMEDIDAGEEAGPDEEQELGLEMEQEPGLEMEQEQEQEQEQVQEQEQEEKDSEELETAVDDQGVVA